MKTRAKKLMSFMLTAAMTAGTMTGMAPVTADAKDKKDARPVQQEFYVSVKDGDDANDGSEDAPFATVEQARKAVDAINDKMTGDIIINIEEGIYYLDKTIQLGKSDSGTNGFEVIYRSADGAGKASLKGGLKVTEGWTKATQEDVDNFDLSADMLGKVYKVQLDENTPDFNTLYVNGDRAVMARTQNRADSERFGASKDTYMYAAGGGNTQITAPAGAIPQAQLDAIQNAINRGEEGAQVYAWDWDYRNWFTSTIPVVGISGTTFKFPASPSDNPQQYRPKYSFGGGARMFLQGNLSFLDVPGEYHYNKKENVLYYYPKEGEENLAEQEVVYPVLQEVFSLKGDAKAKITDKPNPENQVHNVTFEGLEMGYTEFAESYSSSWNAFDAMGVGRFPEEALQEGITQPSFCEQKERIEFRKGVVTLWQTNNITMDGVRIVNTGLNAINASDDNDHLTVKNSEIANIGLHGINIDGGYPGPDVGKYSYGHLITNNVIHDMGQMAGHGTGLQILMVHDSEFSHMEMYNAARRAIFLSGAWANRRPEDSGFNRFRDTHTYDNHLEYLYLHDLQQDGGDDGAIFFSTLYGSWGDKTGYRDNYLNQVYMDNVGAPPSNKDFKPNCINLDMGCSGTHVTNFKGANPQHYNIRWDEGDPNVFFENANMAYYHEKSNSNYKNFDESKMEYDKIGVDKASFPYKEALSTKLGKKDKTDEEYKDLYFRDEFDNGLDDWWKLAGKPGTTPLYYSDNDDRAGNSFLADAFYGDHKSDKGCLIGKPFGTDLNKIVEIDFFDHTNDGMENGYCGMSFQYKLNSFARVDNGKRVVAIGADTDKDFSHYAYKVGSITKVTDIPREYGWHTFKWDYTSGKDVKLYIDDQLIATVPATSFNYVEMGDYGMGGFNAYDNVVIYDGKEAAAPIPLPEPPTPEEPEQPEEPEAVLPGRIEAEDSASRTGNTQIVDGANGGKAVGYISAGDVYTYEVKVTEDCEFPMVVCYASNGAAAFKFQIGDQTIDVNMPNKGSWTNFYTLETAPVKLTKGTYTAKITVVSNAFNIDYFQFGAEKPAVKVEEVVPTVNGGKLILAKGNEVKVPCTIKPFDAENKNVVWSTDDDGSVLTVAADGTIKAVAEGTANVTVTAEENAEIKATFAVEVQNPEASLISTIEKGCTPSADDSNAHPNYQPEKLIDGDSSKGWCGTGNKPQFSAFLEWAEPQTVDTIYLYDLAEHGNFVEQMEIVFNDDEESKIVLENGVPDDGMKVVELAEARTDVKKIEFHILKGTAPYKNFGFGEIKVFSSKPGMIPVNAVGVESELISMLKGGMATLKLPVVVPSTATDKSCKYEIKEGKDVVALTANGSDGIVKNYTVKALKEGTAVIRATAGDVYTDIKVVVGSTETLESLIMEAEDLYSHYEGESAAHKAFAKAIKNAVKVYENSEDINEITKAIDQLDEAMKVFKAAVENPEDSLDKVLDALKVEQPEKGATLLKMPEVPLGYTVEITKTAPADVIAKNGAITIPDQDTNVDVTFKVTKVSDGTSGTKTIAVKVPGYSAQEVMDTVTIASPAKGQNVVLPSVPHGFKVEIVSSTDDIVGSDGKVNQPLDDTEVTLTVKVTKLSNGSSVEKDFTIQLIGVGKKINVAIEANEIDAVHGNYIRVQNNEVVNFNGGDWIQYKDVNFGETEKDIRFHINTAVHPNWAGKKIHVMLDDPATGTNVGTITVKAAGNDWGIYGEQIIELTQKISGVHDVYLLGEGGEGVGGVKAILFEAIKKAEEKDVFTITVDGTAKEYAYNDAVTIEAPETKDGKNFAYWMADGEIVSYKAVYKFYVSKDMEFTAVYENEVVEAAKAMLTNVFVEKREDGKSNVRFVGELVLPEGYKVLEAGLVWSSKDDKVLVTEDGEFGEGLKPTYISRISDTNQFSVTIKGMPADKFIRGVIFAKVADKDGEETYIFSTENKVYAAK